MIRLCPSGHSCHGSMVFRGIRGLGSSNLKEYEFKFECTNASCEGVLSNIVIIAENEKEYQSLKLKVPVPKKIAPNGDMVRQFECVITADDISCKGFINVIYLTKGY